MLYLAAYDSTSAAGFTCRGDAGPFSY